MIVNVTGLSKALRIDFEEVFVNAEVIYHVIHRNMSLGDIGAFRASASSCAFSLTLPVLVRNRLIASLTLFLGLWLCDGGRH